MTHQVLLKDQIRKLVDLQKIDKEIYDYKRELEEKPAYLAELKGKYENKKATLQQLEEKAKSVLLGRKNLELELKTKEDEITKANAQLSAIKTNKEYTAKISEVEHLKADKSIIEEKILLSFEDSDQANAKINDEKKVLAEEEKKYLSEKKIIEDAVKILEDRIKVLQSQRSRITPEVEKGILEKYDRIVEKREGRAIVPVQGATCGGCFMNVPQQVINEIKMNEKLVFCEMCTSILYLEDNL